MATVQNTDAAARVWPNLTNQDTGTTLELDPGAEAAVELPPHFTDPYLKVKPAKTKTPKASGTPSGGDATTSEEAQS